MASEVQGRQETAVPKDENGVVVLLLGAVFSVGSWHELPLHGDSFPTVGIWMGGAVGTNAP